MKRLLLVTICPLLALAYAPENAPREARFADPPASARILPLRHGRANDCAKADAELDALVANGFGGFGGNVNFKDYLDSPESWRTFKYTVERAHARGMALWLYDEQGYPSGTAGGKTLQGHPEWQARAYLVAVTNVPAGSAALPPAPPGRPVATLRRRVGDGERVYVITDGYLLEGTHVSVSVSAYKYPYINLLMAEPTARFIALTHDAYRRELGDALTFFSSTFTDEPSLMTMWMRPMPYYCLPVSDELLAAYAREAGHPLADDVPALLEGPGEGATAATRHRFWSMVGDRVAWNYTGQLTRWATAQGLASGGHLLAEESFTGHVPLYGDFFKVLRGLSAPSCDVLTSLPGQVPWKTGLLAGSAGALNGARYVMSEASDHSQRYRPAGDTRPRVQVTAREIIGSLNRQIWGGVNTFTSYYNWTPFSRATLRAINEEIGRTITLLNDGHAAADIALLYPADALMVGFEPRLRWAGGAGAERVQNVLNRVGQALFQATRAFLFVDDETLETAEIRDGLLVKGDLRWRTVVLPNATTLPIGAVRKLEAFRRAGGFVLAVGERPRNSCTAFPDAEVARLVADWPLLAGAQVAWLPELLAARHEPALRCARGAAEALRATHRRGPQGDVFFVFNDTDEIWSGAVRLAGGAAARIWNPRVGLATAGEGDIALDLPPYGGALLTTAAPVEGRLAAGASTPFVPAVRPLAAAPARLELGKARDVEASFAALPERPWTRVEARLTKGDVDTFAFLNHVYAASPFPATAKGVAFSVRVPETTGGHAHCGIFLQTRDGTTWYAANAFSLSEKGTADVMHAFRDFSPHQTPSGNRRGLRLRPEEIVRVNFGFGGYFGTAGERVVFDVRPPSALEF